MFEGLGGGAMDTTISIIRDEIDYATALIAYEAYFNNEPATGSEDGDRFEMLGLLLAKYEEQRPTP
jgi:antitoxin component HigA of HigAB toxin-antitoxin module